jgi:LETM1-like protein
MVFRLLRLSTVGFNALRIRRIRRHVEFLAVDDQLLLQDGLLGQLSEKDLDEALEERGMSVHSGSP